MTPVINDLADDLLAGDHNATIVTQATADLDTFPAPYAPQSDQDDAAAEFAGLSGNPRPRVAKGKGVRQAHLQARRAPIPHHGFLPGMGGEDDLAGPGGTVKHHAKRHAAKVGPRQTVVRREPAGSSIHHGFLPGMGGLNGGGGQGRPLGDLTSSISLPVLAVGAVAVWYFFLRRKGGDHAPR